MTQQPYFWVFIWRKSNRYLKIYLYPYFHFSTIHSSQDTVTTRVPADRWMKKEVKFHIYWILLSHKKEAIPANCDSTAESPQVIRAIIFFLTDSTVLFTRSRCWTGRKLFICISLSQTSCENWSCWCLFPHHVIFIRKPHSRRIL